MNHNFTFQSFVEQKEGINIVGSLEIDCRSNLEEQLIDNSHLFLAKSPGLAGVGTN